LAKWFTKKYGPLSLETAISGVVQDLLAKTNQANPPVALKPIASLRAIARTIYSARIAGLGRLDPTSEGFVVLLERNWHWLKRREWWAHEIAHTFFYDIAPRPPRRLIPTAEEEELICDLLAREFLIPSAFLNCSDTTPRSPSFLELRRLCKLFQTTTSTMSLRLISDLKIWNAIVLFCEDRQHMFPASKQIRNPGRALRVVHTIGPGSSGSFVPLNKRVDEIVIIHNAFTERRFFKGSVSFDNFGDLNGEKEVEAFPIISGSTGNPGVMVMIKSSHTSHTPKQRDVANVDTKELSFHF
jgi:hypothetical protein